LNGVHPAKGTDDSGLSKPEDEPPQKVNGESVPRDDTPLIIAALIQAHPLKLRWQEFVGTTLAAETAIQSMPLGGFQAAPPTIDPLHAHRPSLNDMNNFQDGEYGDDDDDDDDEPDNMEGGGKSLTIGGEVIALDDNDLEIAASMMDALSLPQSPSGSNSQPTTSGGGFGANFATVEASTGGSNEYVFDDPLGAKGSFDRFGEDEDDSSDEEEEESPASTSGRRESSGPPVMDLFAGNFGFDGADANPSSQQEGNVMDGGTEGGGWSNFANFDDAFAPGAGPFGTENQPEQEEQKPADEKPSEQTREVNPVADVFEESPHDFLLDDPVETEVVEDVESDAGAVAFSGADPLPQDPVARNIVEGGVRVDSPVAVLEEPDAKSVEEVTTDENGSDVKVTEEKEEGRVEEPVEEEGRMEEHVVVEEGRMEEPVVEEERVKEPVVEGEVTDGVALDDSGAKTTMQEGATRVDNPADKTIEEGVTVEGEHS